MIKANILSKICKELLILKYLVTIILAFQEEGIIKFEKQKWHANMNIDQWPYENKQRAFH